VARLLDGRVRVKQSKKRADLFNALIHMTFSFLPPTPLPWVRKHLRQCAVGEPGF
jgi:hypothetical protein